MNVNEFATDIRHVNFNWFNLCCVVLFLPFSASHICFLKSSPQVGIVFAKMTRPKHRTQTLLFSKYAVICQRDSELTLMFRVGDMRKSHIIGASIRAQLIKTKMTKEGEVMSQYQTELEIGTDGCASDLFFIWWENFRFFSNWKA